MKQNEEFDKLFGEMEQVDRSSKARENSWLALKDKINKPKRRKFFPAVISLALVAIASFLLVTYLLPSETEQTADPLSREEVIMGFLEKQYNGPDKEFEKLYNNWMKLESNSLEEKLEESKEDTNFIGYVEDIFEEYIVRDKLLDFINTNLLYRHQYLLIDNELQMNLENVTMEQDKAHPNIYRPIIEVTLTNKKGQQISHTMSDEFIFSNEEANKIGRYNSGINGGSLELDEKIKNFDAHVSQSTASLSNEEVIMGFLEKQYNGPDMEYERLLDEWMTLQLETVVESQEDYDVLLGGSEEYKALMDYYEASFGEYIRKDKFESFINTNLLFQYQPHLLNNSLQMKLEKVTIKQDENYPNIYRPIIDVSLTNNKGQQIFHSLREEFIFSEEVPGKIGSYNWVKNGGGDEFYDKLKNFDAYLTSWE